MVEEWKDNGPRMKEKLKRGLKGKQTQKKQQEKKEENEYGEWKAVDE